MSCRLTRTEIASAERKYQVIEGIFKSGYGMLESAFHGTRLRVENLRQIAGSARAEHVRRKKEHDQLEMRVRELEVRHAALTSELAEKQGDQARAEDLVRERRQALKTALEIEGLSADFDAAKEESAKSEIRLQSLEKAYRDCESKADRLAAEKDRIAEGLSDASKAWEEISRRVALLKLARQTLEDCRKALPDRQVDEESAPFLLEECRGEWDRALESKTRIERELDSLQARIGGYEETLKALREASGKDVSRENALESARTLDADFREMERLANESQNLSERLNRAAKRAERQQAIRKKAALFESTGKTVRSAADLRSLFEAMQTELDLLAGERSNLQDRLAALREEQVLLEQQLARLGPEAREWNQARTLVDKLEAGFSVKIVDGPSLDCFEQSTKADLDSVGGRLRLLHREREAALTKVTELEYGGGRLDEALVRLRDMVDGTLAAELYDDTQEKESSALEARLGPLLGAILVEDIPEAAAIISREPDRPDDVWLLQAGALKDIPEGKPYPGAELVKMGEAWRLSRHPERPVVGRVAREREIERLKALAQNLTEEIETVRCEEARLLEKIEKIGLLKRHYRLLGTPDPGEKIIQLQDRLKEIQTKDLLLKKRMQETASRAQHRRNSSNDLTQILAYADLLDEEDWTEKASSLREQVRRAETIRNRMEAIRPAVDRVRSGMYDLENPPPGPEELAGRKEELARADAVLEYWSRARELLVTLIDRLPHLRYHDQEGVLDEHESALEALKGQKGVVDSELQRVRGELDQAARDQKKAREEFNSADAKSKNLYEKLENLRNDLSSSGQDGTRQSLDDAERFREEAARALETAQKTEREVGNDFIRTEKELEIGSNVIAGARRKREKCIRDLLPHWRTWRTLWRGAAQERLLDRLMDTSALQSYERKTIARAFEEASRHQGELKNILKTIPEAGELQQGLECLMEAPDGDLNRGFLNMQAWILIRRFLERSTPRDIAQADDPEVAVKQIGAHLVRLKGKLDDQQRQLRLRSDAVANSIRTRIRMEERHIHQLNRRLEAVSFGAIAGIRIYLDRVESMQRLLNGLMVQKELFNAQVSLEEAMSELYRQVGGGQVRGDQLLDYREYVRMSVEVQRIGSDKWTKASSNTLSTGESIGVGAAVLMVILDAWEHQAVLLRGNRDAGSMRFLFLDEAARLSPKSLDTLGEFCERMDLQLLVAAPAADRARRGTAYRLVRRLDENGAEEVIVRGRRFTGQVEEVAFH